MKFPVFNRWSGSIQFEADIECSDDATTSIKLGLAVKWAVKTGATLDGAILNGANLYGATIDGASGINDYVKSIQIDTYPICYTHDTMQIGCQRHLISEWSEFTDAQIRQMDGRKALEFWAKYKAWIFQTIELCPAKPTKPVDAVCEVMPDE